LGADGEIVWLAALRRNWEVNLIIPIEERILFLKQIHRLQASARIIKCLFSQLFKIASKCCFLFLFFTSKASRCQLFFSTRSQMAVRYKSTSHREWHQRYAYAKPSLLSVA
jgi:hypothetical protein